MRAIILEGAECQGDHGHLRRGARRGEGAERGWHRAPSLDLGHVRRRLANGEDRARARDLFARAEALTERQGSSPTFWFGNRPGGGIYFNLYGLNYPPFALRVGRDGQLLVIGDWGSWMGRDPEAHAEFAGFLGLNHLGPRRAVPLADYDLDELWRAALRCTEAINDGE